MRYLMRQKFFSLGGRFHIKDVQGRDVFLVVTAAADRARAAAAVY